MGMIDRISRRSFLRGAAGLGAASVLGTWGWETLEGAAWAQEAPHPVSMAMHVHSSFSRGNGLDGRAARRGHGERRRRRVVDRPRLADGGSRVSIRRALLGAHRDGERQRPADLDAGEVGLAVVLVGHDRHGPVLPNDPAATSSLRLAATGSGSAFAYMRCIADSSKARENLKGTIGGQAITFDVFPESIGTSVFLEVRIKLSNQPASGGRAAGAYTLIYRIGGTDAPGAHRVAGSPATSGSPLPRGSGARSRSPPPTTSPCSGPTCCPRIPR